jgi:hypothetical protein
MITSCQVDMLNMTTMLDYTVMHHIISYCIVSYHSIIVGLNGIEFTIQISPAHHPLTIFIFNFNCLQTFILF